MENNKPEPTQTEALAAVDEIDKFLTAYYYRGILTKEWESRISIIRAALSVPVPDAAPKLTCKDQRFQMTPEEVDAGLRIFRNPLAAIAALRKYFREVQICGVHPRIMAKLDQLEELVNITEWGQPEGRPEPESNSADVEGYVLVDGDCIDCARVIWGEDGHCILDGDDCKIDEDAHLIYANPPTSNSATVISDRNLNDIDTRIPLNEPEEDKP